MGRDVVAVVTVLDQRSPTAVIFCVGKTRNQHAPRQCVRAMRSDGAAGGFGEIVDGLDQFRFRRIGMHIKDKDAAGLETGEPELTPVVGESAVVRFVASLDGIAADDFAIGGRARFDIHGDQFVRAVAQTFNAERPNVNELLLPIDAGKVR